MTVLAQLAVGRVLNSLPEGLLIALCAWLLLRLMGRQNSGTRFAVWMVALAGVVALPFLGGSGSASGYAALLPHTHPEIAVPVFWAVAFFVVWIAIAALALGRIIAGLWQVRRIRRGCTEIPSAALDPALRALLADVKRPVRLLASETARVPAALGFRRPAIVLPAWTLRDLTGAELRPIVLHELAHLCRRDDWTNLLQKAVRAILFFHPAVWWIDARLSLEREMACDDAVLAATGNARAYAGCLIDLLERGCARRGWTMAQAAVARARDASVRIARILQLGPAVTTRIGRGALAGAAALAVGCAGMALVTPRLVAFVPMESASSAQLSVPSLAQAIHAPVAAVIPAAFHPSLSQSRLADDPVKPHRAASHASPLRRAIAPKPRAPESPLMTASLSGAPAMNPQPVAAQWIVADDADSAASMPVVVIFETRRTPVAVATEAQLRTAATAPRAKMRQLRSREDPALQVQVFEVIDPATGTPVQILRIVLTVPQPAGSSAQSI